ALEMRAVFLGKYPEFEREARREGAGSDKALILENHTLSIAALLADDIAEDAAFLEAVVAVRAAQLLLDAERDDRQCDQLRVRMLEAGPGLGAVILEHDRVAEPLVLGEVEHAFAVHPEHFLDLMLAVVGHPAIVIGHLDDHLVRADPVHQIVESLAAAA